jgi:hypothetical protein
MNNITIHVRDALTKNSIVNALISVMAVDGLFGTGGTTDTLGNFTFQNLALDTHYYNIDVTAGGYVEGGASIQVLALGDQTFNIDLSTAPGNSGNVLTITVYDITTGQSSNSSLSVHPGDQLSIQGVITHNGTPITVPAGVMVIHILNPDTGHAYDFVGAGYNSFNGNYKSDFTVPESSDFRLQAWYVPTNTYSTVVYCALVQGGTGQPYHWDGSACVVSATGEFATLDACTAAHPGSGGHTCNTGYHWDPVSLTCVADSTTPPTSTSTTLILLGVVAVIVVIGALMLGRRK